MTPVREPRVLVAEAAPGGAAMITPCCETLVSVPADVVRLGKGTCPLCGADIERDVVKGRWIRSKTRSRRTG